MEVVRRQSSQSSCAASERIMALGGQAKPQEMVLAPVDLDTAEKHMDKIENALRTIKDRLAEIMKTCPLGALPANLRSLKGLTVLFPRQCLRKGPILQVADNKVVYGDSRTEGSTGTWHTGPREASRSLLTYMAKYLYAAFTARCVKDYLLSQR